MKPADALYIQYANSDPIGIFPMNNFGGLEILDIEHGINDIAIACFNFGAGRQKIKRHKIYTSPSGRCYIRKEGRKFYFDQILRYVYIDD